MLGMQRPGKRQRRCMEAAREDKRCEGRRKMEDDLLWRPPKREKTKEEEDVRVAFPISTDFALFSA